MWLPKYQPGADFGAELNTEEDCQIPLTILHVVGKAPAFKIFIVGLLGVTDTVQVFMCTQATHG